MYRDYRPEELTYEKKLVIRSEQVDINGHMNNASYFDMIDDAVWADVSSRAAAVMPVPKTVYINYVNEIKAGVHLTLKEYKDAGTTYFEGTGDKQFFRARYEY